MELNVNYLAAVKLGERATVKGRVLKLGKTLGFTQVEIFNEQGRHSHIHTHTHTARGRRERSDHACSKREQLC